VSLVALIIIRLRITYHANLGMSRISYYAKQR